MNPIDLLPVVLSFAGTLVLTPVVRALARRRGVVARPKSDRWHKKPTALLGGGAIFTVVAAVDLALVPLTPQARVVLGAGAFLFLVGLIDDFFNLKPYQKLSGQIMGAAVVVWCGLTLPWTGSLPVNMAITLFWLIGITNAVNLLDNMDGLAAGIAAIASTFLALNFLGNGQAAEALMLAVFGAALLGFLVYNSNPASIFMGDCGSMFIGFFLAGSALLNPTGGRSRTVLPVLAVPVLTLFIPIFDTLLVTILRKLAGRSVARGGRDHTSHRLVALGLSERRAVWMLYALAAVSGLLGLLVRDLALDYSLAAVLGYVLLLTFVGVHLGGVKVYDEAEVRTARAQPLVAFLVDLSYKRRVFEVLLDVVLIALSYYLAYAVVFGHLTGDEPLRRFLLVVPVLVSVKLLTFLGMGVYRGLWRYVSIDDLIVFAKAVLIASVVSVLALLFAFRFEGFSRVVFILDGLILLVLLTGSRLTFHLFRQLLPAPRTSSGHRVLIYGAGDAGELLARELLNNASLQCTPVGFADDDPLKKGKIIHGLRVFGGNGSFLTICGQQAIDEVLISSMKFTPERLEEIARECATLSLPLRRMRFQIEALDDGTGSAARSLRNRLGQPDAYLA
jgi:UDP-GlcNAc:undecaprenyl-phosphate/decaprenyl-phosphate GlcNAc-1-phosphate transferase